MAPSSFKEDVIIDDSKKAEEIARTLRQPKDKSIQSSQPDKLPDNANKIWFNHSNK